MQNTPDAFIKPHFADEPLPEIVEEWLVALEARNLSAHTISNYRKAVSSFQKSLTLHDKPLTLASLSESNVLRWQKDLLGSVIPRTPTGCGYKYTPESKPVREVTRRSYLINVKVFSNRWVKRHYSHHDLLDLVEVGKDIVEPKEGLTVQDRETILRVLDGQSFEEVRDRAFVQLLLATACRFKEIYGLSTTTVDMDNKRLWVVLKGGRQVPVDVDGRALRDLRVYLGRRRVVADSSETALWVADGGKPLTYWGANGIFARLEQRSGVKCNPHRFRHTLAQHMAEQGAPVADIQDALHHTSDRMSRRYIGNARTEVAAGLAKKWSLAG